jgi:serine protease AprX
MTTEGPNSSGQERRRRAGSRATNDFRDQLCKTVIAMPLLDLMRTRRGRIPIIVDLNFGHLNGLKGAKVQACRALLNVLDKKAVGAHAEMSLTALLEKAPAQVDRYKTELCAQYVFAELTPVQIRAFLDEDKRLAQELANGGAPEQPRDSVHRPFAYDVDLEARTREAIPQYRCHSIYKIWPDFETRPMVLRTVSTVKADAARISFSANGRNIVWAVVDSGIDGKHPHFMEHRNLELPAPLRHADFTKTDGSEPYVKEPVDDFGHGTHVAGIIAGELTPSKHPQPLDAVTRTRDQQGVESYEKWPVARIAGIAPECKLMSIKVLDSRGRSGKSSNILAALAYINELNAYGRNIQIHGVNLSVGYEFEAEWFGCGHSPLCVEVNRLVSSGVVVVAAAGNTGYGVVAPTSKGPNMAGLSLTINDPGNAERAITVGSTHRYMPQQYGVSYFSSKGPTGDGRMKPDLVAPGENVLSCAAGRMRDNVEASLAQSSAAGAAPVKCSYLEESGTSMAAPHLSGAIAAFLSIRPGYIGCPDDVKRIFLSTATDLGRQREFQGYGLVDLMRAIQSV